MEDMMRSIGRSTKESKLIEQSTPTMDLDDETDLFNIEWLNSKKFLKQLGKDNIDVELLRDELSRQNRRKRHLTWKEKTYRLIKKDFVQAVLCLLILIDAGIVITEIILEIHSMKNKKKDAEKQSSTFKEFINATFNYFTNYTNLRNVSIDDIKNNIRKSQPQDIISWCNRTFVLQTPLHHINLRRRARHVPSSGEGIEDEDIFHKVGLYLHYISIGVLAIFMVELALRVICTGEKFFKKKSEIFDGIIILTSFPADIVFVYWQSPEISVMVIVLLWRIVRLINGLMMHEKQRDEFRITLQKKTRRTCQLKVNSLSTEKELLMKHVVSLEELCRELGSNEEQLKNCKPRFKKYSKEQTNNALKSIAALTTGFMGGMVGAPSSNQSAINRFSGTSPNPSMHSPNNSRRLKIMRKISETPYSSFENSENEMTPITSHTLFLPSSDSPVTSFDRESPFRLTVNNARESCELKPEHSLRADSETDDNDQTMVDVELEEPLMTSEREDITNPHLLDICIIQRQSTKSSNEDQEKSHDKDSNANAHSKGYGSSVSPSTSTSEPNETDIEDSKPSVNCIFTQAERCRSFREKFRSQDIIQTQESSLDSPPSVDEGIGSTTCSHFPMVSSSK